MKIGAVIQARTSSKRFPGKILKYLPYDTNITVLEQVIHRLKKSKKLNEIIIATTTDENDRKIVEIAKKENVSFYEGSKNNVLERYYLAAKKNDLDVVVRITSDCPCMDPDIVDLVLETHLNKNSDYTSNTLMRTFPVGLDVEVMSFQTLEKCYNNAKTDLEKEHVTFYVHNNLNKFKIENVVANGPNESRIRITLDTEEDYILLCAIFDYLYKNDEIFKLKEILKLFKDKPWLILINEKIIAKKSYETFEDEIKDALRVLELQELNNAKELLQKCYKCR